MVYDVYCKWSIQRLWKWVSLQSITVMYINCTVNIMKSFTVVYEDFENMFSKTIFLIMFYHFLLLEISNFNFSGLACISIFNY